MKTPQEIMGQMNEIYNNYKNADDAEKLQTLVDVYSVYKRFGYMFNKESKKTLNNMLVDYFYPAGETELVDTETLDPRATLYQQKRIDSELAFYNKILQINDELNEKDTVDGHLDYDKERHNKDRAVVYGNTTVEYMDYKLLRDMQEDARQAARENNRIPGQIIIADGYEEQRFNKMKKEQMNYDLREKLLKINEYPDSTIPQDEALKSAEEKKYDGKLLETPITKEFVDFDLKNEAGYKEWYELQTNEVKKEEANKEAQRKVWAAAKINKNLMDAFQNILDNKKDGKENSDLYNNIINSYVEAMNAQTPSEFVMHMRHLSDACVNYVDNRHPIFQEGKERKKLVKQLHQIVEEEIMPEINEKLDTFEVVDKDKVIGEMAKEGATEKAEERAEEKTKTLENDDTPLVEKTSFNDILRENREAGIYINAMHQPYELVDKDEVEEEMETEARGYRKRASFYDVLDEEGINTAGKTTATPTDKGKSTSNTLNK